MKTQRAKKKWKHDMVDDQNIPIPIQPIEQTVAKVEALHDQQHEQVEISLETCWSQCS